MVDRIRRAFAVAGLCAGLAATGANAQHAGKGPDNSDKPGNRGTPLREVTADEARELIAGIANLVDQSTAGLTLRISANGTQTVDLEDRFHAVSLARLTTDGRLVSQCVGTQGEALEFLTRTSIRPHVHARAASALQGIDTTALVPARRRAAPAAVLEEK